MRLLACLAIVSIFLFFVSPGRSEPDVGIGEQDPFLWLEAESDETAKWVDLQNATTHQHLVDTTEFEKRYANTLAHRISVSAFPKPTVVGKHIYHVFQDEKQVLGLLRRTSWQSYLTGAPEWEKVLDIDALAEQEQTRWNFKSIDCLSADSPRCFIGLASGGIDYVSYREFDLVKKAFIEDGYPAFVSKLAPKWMDGNHIYVGLTQERDSVTQHSFAANIKLWQRHTPKEKAKVVFQVLKTDLGLFTYDFMGGDRAILVGHYKSFHDFSHVLLEGENSYPVIADGVSKVYGVFENGAVIKLATEHMIDGQKFKTGSIVSIDLASIRTGTPRFTQLAEAKPEYPIESISVTQNSLLIQRLVDVKSEASLLQKDSHGTFKINKVALPANGVIEPMATLYEQDMHLVSYESFVRPKTLYRVGANQQLKKLYEQSALVKSEDFVTKQYFATSKDGTKIPYFLVHRKNMNFDAKNPTMIRSYGGFNISNLPRYSSSMTAWLDTGGALVMANVRGGGEYGERWHRAAIKENKVKSFEDLIAVAEDLMAKKVTSPEHLGLFGISAGGLLVSATAVQRPDLFKAVVAGAPLIDMLRYHVLGDGSPYIGEYGNPAVAQERAYISQYSPYHNINTDKHPQWLFITSSKDMRVHPAHARKMAAKLQSKGHKALFYEFADGGHAAAVGLDERAFRDTLVSHFIYTRLTQSDKN